MEIRTRKDARSVCVERRYGATQHEASMSAGENLEQEICLIFLLIFVCVLLGCGRRGQRKDEGDLLVVVALIPAGAEKRRIGRTSACGCFLLLVFCCCLLLQLAAAACLCYSMLSLVAFAP